MVRGLCHDCETFHRSDEHCEEIKEIEADLAEPKTTIERAADQLDNLLEANRRYHTTKAPWEKRQ